jgi:transcriptional regulator with XRE-family HTH domain
MGTTDRRTIRQWRIENGLTQRQLAERLGVTHITIGNWENGRNAPSAYQLVALGRVFNVPVEQINFDRDTARSEREQSRSQPDGGNTQGATK